MTLMKRIELDEDELMHAIFDYLKRWYPDVWRRHGAPKKENMSVDGVYDILEFDKSLTVRVDYPEGTADALNVPDAVINDIIDSEPA